MYVSDEQAVRDGIATFQEIQIEQERAFTIERIERLRRFATGETLDRREREEWRHFHERTYVMEREIEVMIRALADVEAYRLPNPIIVPVR